MSPSLSFNKIKSFKKSKSYLLGLFVLIGVLAVSLFSLYQWQVSNRQAIQAAVALAGTEFQVNSYTNSYQQWPDVAMGPNGYVVVWQSNGQDGSFIGVFAKRYDSDGNELARPAGVTAGDGPNEFQVADYVTSHQSQPSVAIDASGNFVITWESYQDGSQYGIFAKMYNSSGEEVVSAGPAGPSAVGNEFQVNVFTNNAQRYPDIDMDSSGNFVIAWRTDIQDGSSEGIYAQRYLNTGAKIGSPFQVNTTTAGNQLAPAVAVAPSGSFVIAWQDSNGNDGDGTGIFAQAYDNTGVTIGSELSVNDETTDDQEEPVVAAYDSGFVILWESVLQNGGTNGVYGKRYNSSAVEITPPVAEKGTGVGNEFQLPVPISATVGYQSRPSVSMDSSGNFTVIYTTDNNVFGQRYDDNISKVGNRAFKVNFSELGNSSLSAVSMSGPESFVTAWTNHTGNDGSLDGVYAQQYEPALGVTSITPAQNAVDVSASSNIVIIFDRSLNTSTVNQTNLPIYGSGPLLDGTYTFSDTTLTDDTVTFNPDNDFAIGTTVEVVVSDNVQSSGGLSALPFASNFIVEATAGQNIFFPSVNYSLGGTNTNFNLAQGDFDGDGDIDLVTGALAGQNALIFTNDGFGGFTSSTLQFSPDDLAVTTGDVDNDGDLDIISADDDPRVRVFLNNGSGSFTTVNDYNVPQHIKFLTLADADGDGDLDVYGSVAVRGLLIVFNNGSGGFGTNTFYSLSSVSGVMKAADIDNDGDMDAISAEFDTEYFEVLTNNGTGLFETGIEYYADNYGVGLDVEDVNGDGFLDVVREAYDGSEISVFLNNGDGSFATHVIYPALNLSIYSHLALGDFDSDGDLDILLPESDTVVYLNNGAGSFTPVTHSGLGSNAEDGLVVADLNGDGALDFAGADSSNLIVTLSDGPPQTTIIQPNGGETIAPSSMYDIIWHATDDSGAVDTIDLEFTDDDSSYSPIGGATGLANGEEYFSDSIIAPTGLADGEMSDPQGVEFDSAGNLYVADTDNHRINKFDSSGDFVGWYGKDNVQAGGFHLAGTASNPISGSGNGEFNLPTDIAFDSSGNLYISDLGNDRYQQIANDGTHLASIGSTGLGDGQFNLPIGIALDSTGNIYILDNTNHSVSKFNSSNVFQGWLGKCNSGANCNSQKSIGFTCTAATCTGPSFGFSNGQFFLPVGIAVDSANNVYVSDKGNGRVQKFDSSGTHLDNIGNPGGGPGLISQFNKVDVDAVGNVYITDSGREYIHKYDSSGVFIMEYGFWPPGSVPEAFLNPAGIAVTSTGNLFIADSGNNRVQSLTPGGTFSWSVPASTTSLARISVVATDGASNVSETDSASTFIIGSGGRATIRLRKALEDELRQQAGQESVLVPEEGESAEEPKEEVHMDVLDMGLVKTSDRNAVYYVDKLGVRHLFPNEDIYSSWYPDFSEVEVIPQEQLDALETGAPIFMRPGTWLVKIRSDAKVYAVEPGGVLRWIPSEEAAVALYGENWNLIIKDLPDAFFTFYSVGDPLSMAPIVYADGTVLSVVNGPNIVFIQGAGYLSLSDDDLAKGRFQTKFFLETDSLVGLNLENKGPFPPFTFDQLIVRG